MKTNKAWEISDSLLINKYFIHFINTSLKKEYITKFLNIKYLLRSSVIVTIILHYLKSQRCSIVT